MSEASGKLVLGVTAGEYVQIGDDVKVYVTTHKSKTKKSLRLSIIAPRDIKILRGNIIEKELTGTQEQPTQFEADILQQADTK